MPWRPLTIVVARLMVSLSLALPTSRLSVALRTMRLPRSTSCTAGAEALAVAPPLDGAPAAGAAASLPPPAAAPPTAHLRNSDLGQQGIAGDAQAHKDRGPTLSKSLLTPQLQLRDRVRAEVPRVDLPDHLIGPRGPGVLADTEAR